MNRKFFYPLSLGCLGSWKLQNPFPSKKTLDWEEEFEGSKPIWQMSLFPFLPSGAAASLGLDLVFSLGLFLLAKGDPGRAEPLGVLIRARVFFCSL